MTKDEVETFAKDNGHPPSAEGVVCVDFDSTIAPFGNMFDFPEPLPGAKKFLKYLRDEGYKIVIFTSRLSTVWHAAEGRDPAHGIAQQVLYLRDYFDKYGLEADSITAEKIPAMAYIDDKAIEFHGSWATAKSKFRQRTKDRVSPLREEAQ